MKVHVGSDSRGIVHTVTTTDVETPDIAQLDNLLHGQDRTLFGDHAYYKLTDKVLWEASGGAYRAIAAASGVPSGIASTTRAPARVVGWITSFMW